MATVTVKEKKPSKVQMHAGGVEPVTTAQLAAGVFTVTLRAAH